MCIEAPTAFVGPDTIRSLRSAYGLSAREFGRFLGFGEQTELRYEMGTIPEPTHNSIILSAMTREAAERLLEQNGERIAQKSRDLVRDYIEHHKTYRGQQSLKG
jgi:transcriptional regulator with XRE-family HTH domain